MPEPRPPCPAELRRQMVGLVRAGRNPAHALGPSAQAIRAWVLQADPAEGRREAKPMAADGTLTVAEREEPARLRREDRRLRQERAILSRATAWFAGETGVIPPGSSGSWARAGPGSRSPA